MKRVLVCVISVGCWVSAALAADYTWLGGNGLFADPAMWSPTGVPGLNDNAKFSASAPGTVTWTENTTNATLTASAISGNTLVLDLAGHTHVLTNRFLFEGDKANSFLVVSNGFLVAPTNYCDVKINQGVAPARLTFANGAVATLDRLYTWRSDVNVQTGAVLICNNETAIGNGTPNSVSALNINGGTLTLNNHLWMNGGTNSTSTLNIADGRVVAKKYFSIGNTGAGTGWGILNLSGGYLETWSDVWLGNASAARGLAIISGGTWIVTNSNFEVAHGGYTTSWLNMSGGEITLLTSGKNFIVANCGNGHYTTGTVSVVGGTLTVTNNASIYVGNSSNGLGRVYVGGTGCIHARNFYLGTYKTARGECSVTGGLLQVDSTLNVGTASEGTGYLGVEDGTVTALGSIGIGSASGAAGSVAVNGGYVTTPSFTLGSVSGAAGSLSVNGGTVFTPQITVGSSGGTSGSFALTNGTVYLTSGKLTVGSSGTGVCYIAGGSLTLSNDFSIGANAGGTGTVYMTGGDVLCTNNLKVGDWGGSGTFVMQGGTFLCRNGSIIVANGNGSTGTLFMAGGRMGTPQNMTIGNNLQKGAWGTLAMSGGELFASNTLALGSSVTNWGRAFVTGGSIEANNMTVGGSGEGHWTQSNGDLTVRANLAIGNNATGTGTVALAGGTLTCRGTVTVASSGYGTLTVSDGTLAVTNSLTVADSANSIGFLTLAGGYVSSKGGNWGNRGVAQTLISGGTNAFSGTVNVGVYSQAVLTVTGGSNTFSGLVVAGNNVGASATATFSGGQTLVTGYTDIGKMGPGLLEVKDGELITAYLRLDTGTTTVPVPPLSEIKVSGGLLKVLTACYIPDTLTITGKLTLAGGVLAVPVLQQWKGALHVLFDGGTLQPTASASSFILNLDVHALTGNGLVVDTAGFNAGTALALPDAAGEHGRLVKKGLGTFSLNGATTFTGPVLVQGGELALGSGGLITLAGGCEIDGGALLNLSARTLDFTVPADSRSRIDGELRLASGKALTVASGATLSGTGTVGRVVLESGATFARDVAAGSTLMNVGELVIPAGAMINLLGYTAEELRQGIAVVSGRSLTVGQGGGVTVTLDGVTSALPVALRVSGGTLTAISYDPGTVIRIM